MPLGAAEKSQRTSANRNIEKLKRINTAHALTLSSAYSSLTFEHTGWSRGIIQGGAEETHVFHIRIILFIFNIKSFNSTKKKAF
jgi:hypothetical protein